MVFDPLNDVYRAEFEGEQVWFAAVGGLRRPLTEERLAGGWQAADLGGTGEAIHTELGHAVSLPRLQRLLANQTGIASVTYISERAELRLQLPRAMLSHHRTNSRIPLELRLAARGAVALLGSTRAEDLEAVLWRLRPALARARVA